MSFLLFFRAKVIQVQTPSIYKFFKLYYKKINEKNLIFFKNINFFESQKTKLIYLFNNQKLTKYVDLKNIYYLLYTQCYYSKLVLTPTKLLNLNSHNLIPINLLNYALKSINTYTWKSSYILSDVKFLEMIFICFLTKNFSSLINWFRAYFEKINLKKHKKLFLFIKLIFQIIIWNYNTYFLIRGCKIAIKGKFAKTGSVRKSVRYIKVGQTSRVSKNLGAIFKKTTIRTLTGVLGVKFEIYF